MLPPLPLISVIVVCKNPGPALSTALDSVWAQKNCLIEVIVIDGASTDGTPEWLRSRHERFSYWISEPDSGVYDAMNKGIAAASGTWLLFLGADDRLIGDTTLSNVATWLQQTKAGVVGGGSTYSDGRIYQFAERLRPVARNSLHHQAAFYRRSLFAEHGSYDATLRIMADYDLNARLLSARVPFKPIPLRISACQAGGLSDSGAWGGYREEIVVRHRYWPAWQCLPWDMLSIARYARKRILRASARK